MQPEHGAHDEISSLVVELLREKAPMLREYLAMDLDSTPDPATTGSGVSADSQTGHIRLASLPMLLEGYVPDLDYLPELILRLGRDVDWESEKGCFQTLAEVRPWAGCMLIAPLQACF